MKKYAPVEVYPLIAAVGVGLGLVVYATAHHFKYNPDVASKRSSVYGWERYNSPDQIEPHLHFLEGEKQNLKAKAFVQAELAKGRIFAGSPEALKETSGRQ